jgi:hypothetical protein
MSTAAKVLVVLNLVLAVAFLASAGTYLGYQDHWRGRFTTETASLRNEISVRDEQLEASRSQVQSLTGQITSALAGKAAAEQQAQAARTQNEMLWGQNNTQAAALRTATETIEAMKTTIENTRTLVTTLQNERQQLAEALRAANDAKDARVRQLNALQVQYENLMREKEALEGRLSDTQQSLERVRFEVESLRSGADVPTAQPGHQGRVLAADNDMGIVIISLGSEDGVRTGFVYRVQRGNRFIGRIEITDVQARKASGRVDRTLSTGPIQTGDVVMTR